MWVKSYLRGNVRFWPQRGRTRNNAPVPNMIETSPRSADAASTLSMAAQNLINMVAVSAVSGTVLLGLLAAKHF
jgi:hypothetical protein